MKYQSNNEISRSMPRIQGGSTLRDALVAIEAHARGMWRYRWSAVAFVWLVSVAGWIFVYSMPDVYEANARIYVDTENAILPLLGGIAFSSDVLDEVTAVTRELLSRPNLAEVARSTKLDYLAKTDEDFELLLSSLQSRIQVIGNRDNIFTIAFQDPDREKAIKVVDSLVNTFVEKFLGADRSESSQAQEFLQRQIGEYEARLTSSEDRLVDFRRQNIAFMPGQRGGYFARLQESQAAIDETERKLRLAKERRTELQRQIEGEEPVFGIMPSSSPESDSGFSAEKIRELQVQLDELRLQYTDKHPRIGQLLETIEFLEKKREEERLAAADNKASPGAVAQAARLESNPVFQNMRIQLTNTEVEIASLSAELTQQQQRADESRKQVDTVPQVEAELGRLNRDYDVVKSKYEQLLQQLETAQIGEDVNAAISGAQFQIIDPPFASLEAAGPQRQIFLAAVLLGALGIGGALTLLLNQLHPVFFSSRTVTTVTALPVLGTVGIVLSPQKLRSKRASRIRFATAMTLLFVSYGAISFFVKQLSPVIQSISGMLF